METTTMRHLTLAAALLLPLAAHAQVACAPADNACRVQHNDSAALGAKLDAILSQLKSAPAGTTTAGGGTTAGTPGGTTAGGTGGTTAGTPGTPAPPPAALGTADETTKTFTAAAGIEPADAMAAMKPGWTLIVAPGTYRKSFTTAGTLDGITLRCAVASKCVMDGQGGYGQGHRLTWGKACIHIYNNSATIEGFRFVRCGSPQSGNSYSNEAGVYLDVDDGQPGHTLHILHDAFDDNANGVFAAAPGGAVLIEESVFGFAKPNGMNGYAVGTASGPAHDMYLQTGAAGTVEVKGSYFYGSAAHNVKTRAGTTNIHDNPLMTMDGGRVADLSEGGKLVFDRNTVWSRDDTTFPPRTIQPGLRAGLWGNSNMVAAGTENVNAGVPSGSITNSTFNLARINSTIWIGGGGRVDSSGNTVHLFGSGGLQTNGIVTGDLTAASAPPGAPAHAPAPPAPPAWFVP